MKIRHSRGAIAAMVSLGLLAGTMAAPPATAAPPTNPVSDKAVTLSTRPVDVIVMFTQQPTTPSQDGQARTIASQQSAIDEWSRDYGLSVRRQFGYLLNGIAASVPENYIPQLEADPRVESVKKERVYQPVQNSARGLEGVPAAAEKFGVDGTGMVVAIIDTGVDTSHQDMRLDDCSAAKIQYIDPSPEGHFTCKVPTGHNYADENDVVKDLTASQHGMHVAGIVAANGSEGSGPDAQPAPGRVDGVAPNAQILAMKVFSNTGGGAKDGDVIAAIEDSVKLGADVLNMSLGSPNGLPNESDGTARAIEKARAAGVLTVISAGNSGLNFSPAGETDDALGLIDDGTVGAPGVQLPALTVASMENSTITSFQAYTSAAPDAGFDYLPVTGQYDGQDHPVVYVGYGREEDYADGQDLAGAYALIERGEIPFRQKFDTAEQHGASGVVVFNSPSGGDELAGMGGVDDVTYFSAFLRRSDGLRVVEQLRDNPATTIRFTPQISVRESEHALTPSRFTSWGPTPTLDFKPDIAGIGGNVYSTLNDNYYGSMSGTSMAAPNVAGLSALMLEHADTAWADMSRPERLDAITTALMNTTEVPVNEAGIPYPPRQIGAGLARVDQALNTSVLATVEGKPSVALREVSGERSMTVTLRNLSDAAQSFTVPAQEAYTENTDAGEATSMRSSHRVTADASSVTVPAHGSATVTFTLHPGASTQEFVEGWLRFVSQDSAQPNLAVPYLGFVGDWDAEPIFIAPGEEGLAGSAARTELMVAWHSLRIPLTDATDTFWVSPNDDDIFDNVGARYSLLRSAQDVEFEILDSAENHLLTLGSQSDIRRLTLGEHLAATDASELTDGGRLFDGYLWNPAAAAYERVPEGQYIYRIKARMSADGPWQHVDMPFGIDVTPPSIVPGTLSGTTLDFTFEDSTAGVLGMPRAVRPDGTEYEVEHVSGNTYRATIDDADTVSYITLDGLDMGGNKAEVVVLVQDPHMVIPAQDTLNDPAAAVGPHSDNVTDGALSVTGVVSADVARVTVNGADAQLEEQAFAASVPLTEGRNTITVIAYNAAGAEVSRQVLTPFYDTTPPTLTISPDSLNADGEVELAADGTVTVSGTVTDERPGARLHVMVYGEELPVNADGSFTATVTPVDDEVFIAVAGSDGANTTTTMLRIAGRVDTPDEAEWIGPSITNAQCIGGYSVCFVPGNTTDLSDGVFTLRGDTNNALGSIEVTLPKYVDASGRFVTPEPVMATVDGDTWSVPVPVHTGENHMRVVIRDQQGDTRIDQSVALYVDVQVPSIAFESPTLKGGTLFTNKPEVTFAGTVEDDGWGYSLAINRDSAIDVFHQTGIGAENNRRSFSHEVSVSDGDTILVTLVDSNDNLLTALIPVVVDTVNPDVSLTEAQEGEHVSTDRVLHASASDEHLASMKVRVNGQVVEERSTKLNATDVHVEDVMVDERTAGSTVAGSLVSTAETTLTADISTESFASGYNTITVESTDLAGNVSATSMTVLVDRAPVVTAPQSIALTVDRSALNNRDELVAEILKQVSVSDDLTANPSVSVVSADPLTAGDNQVTIVATDERGNSTEVTVTVSIELATVTLTADGVSATGPFSASDSLVVTRTEKDGEVLLDLSTAHGVTGVTATISLALPENTRLEQVLSNGARGAVEGTEVDGLFTFTGLVEGHYVLVPVPASDAATGGTRPGDATRPGGAPVYTDAPSTGAAATAGTAAAQKAAARGRMATTGTQADSLAALSAMVMMAGAAALVARRRKAMQS